MTTDPRPHFDIANIVAPVVVSFVFVGAMSLLSDDARRRLSALLIAGAGAVYFGAGLGWWEVAFCALLTWLAFRGWNHYGFIGFA